MENRGRGSAYRARVVLWLVLIALLAPPITGDQATVSDAAAREIERVLGAFRESDALLSTYLLHDPQTLEQARQVGAYARFLSAADPDRPGLTCIPAVADADLRRALFEAAATRVFLTDPYPLRVNDPPGDLVLGASNEGPDLFTYLAQCRQMAGQAPVWAILQAEGDGQALRPPTPEEIRLTTWVALAAGVKGIIYHSYAGLVDEHLRPVDGRCAEIHRLSRALQELTPALLDTAPCEPFAEGPEGVTLGCFVDHEGRPVLMVVNEDVSAPVRPVIELDTAKLGSPWQAQDIVSRLALPARGEGDVVRIAPPLAPGGGAALIIRCDKRIEASAPPPGEPFGEFVPCGLWYVPGAPRDAEGSAHPYRRAFASMVKDLGVNLVIAYDTPFDEADDLLKAAEREQVEVLLHVTELGEALFPGTD